MSTSRIALASCVLAAALGAGSWGAVQAFPLSTRVASIATDSVAHDQNLAADPGPPLQTQTTSNPALPPPPPPAGDSAAQAAEPPMPADFKEVLERLKPIRIGKDAKAPVAKKTVNPEYPDGARAARLQGGVQLEAIVDAEGKVAAVRVLRSVAGLDQAAIGAARQWEFTPALLNGTPTAARIVLEMTFTLR